MSSIIPSSFTKSNFFNHSPNRVSTLNNLKPHSADIAFLLVLRFLTLKGHKGYCYLSSKQWNEWLVKFNGKALKRTAFKDKRRKYLQMGWIRCWYPNGNKNLSYNYVLTEEGIAGVDKYLASCDVKKSRKKTDPLTDTVKDPNVKKTDPPLNHDHDQENIKDIKADTSVDKFEMSREEICITLERLSISEDTMDRLMCRYSEDELIYGIMEMQKRKPKIKWAYFRKTMENNFGNKDCFFRIKENRRNAYE